MLCLSLSCRTSWSSFCHGPKRISSKNLLSWFKPSSPHTKKWINHKNKQCQTAAQTLSHAGIQFLAWNCSKSGYYSLQPPPLHSSCVWDTIPVPQHCWPPCAPHLPQGQYSQESHRKCWSLHLQTCSPCTSQSQQSWCAPRCPGGHCPASSLCGGREENPILQSVKHTSYSSRLHLLHLFSASV